MNPSPVFIRQLTDAIYHSDLASSDPQNFDEKVTLTEAVTINNGRITYLPGTTLKIKRPAER